MAAGRLMVTAIAAGALGVGAAGCGPSASGSGPSARVHRTLGIPTPNLPNGVVVGPTGAAAGAATSEDDLLTYGYGDFRDGVEPGGPSLRHLGARPAWDQRSINASIYGQPLIDGSEVIVGAENDNVYGLAASSGRILWKVSIGKAVSQQVITAGGAGCGDINPTGITGTPVIDQKAGEVFVAGEVLRPARPAWKGIAHVMAAISLSRHKLLWEQRIDPPGAGSVYAVAAEQQRSAMTLADGRLYTSFGGRDGDCGNYQGYVLSLPESGTARGFRYFKVPTTREGAIWAVGGASVAADGQLFVTTGNSANGPGDPFDFGDSVIGLSPLLRMKGHFAPSDWARLNAGDLDLGSDGPTLLPGGELIFQTGKHSTYANNEDVGYLLAPGRLGGIGRPRFSGPVCPDGDGAWGANAAARVRVGTATRLYVYVPCQSGTVALVVNNATARFTRAWQSSGGSPNGPPIVAGGLLWALDWYAGTLYGMQTTTGRVVVKRSVDPVAHFATPGAGDGMLFVATLGGVEAFKPV